MTETDPSESSTVLERAVALSDEGARLALLGQYQDAVPILSESMRLHRSIEGPHPSLLVVAATLNDLGFCLGRLHQHRLAIGALEEARQLAEPIWKANPGAEVCRLVMTRILGALGWSLALLGEFQAALPVTELLVRLERSLHEPGPVQVDFDLAKDLRLFALVRARVGSEGEQAYTAISEAVVIFEYLVQQDPARYAREQITTFDVLAEVLDLVGRQDDAALVRSHVAEQYEALAQAMERAGRHDEATGIRDYAASLATKS